MGRIDRVGRRRGSLLAKRGTTFIAEFRSGSIRCATGGAAPWQGRAAGVAEFGRLRIRSIATRAPHDLRRSSLRNSAQWSSATFRTGTVFSIVPKICTVPCGGVWLVCKLFRHQPDIADPRRAFSINSAYSGWGQSVTEVASGTGVMRTLRLREVTNRTTAVGISASLLLGPSGHSRSPLAIQLST